MKSMLAELRDSVESVDRERVAQWIATLREAGPSSSDALSVAETVALAYPALFRHLETHPEDVSTFARGIRTARDARTIQRALRGRLAGMEDERVAGVLSAYSQREKLRIAARELLQGVDVDVTARELSHLADACIGAALDAAFVWAEERFGIPIASNGERCPFSVLGMGKLGGLELNAGSDVDLIFLYATDDGSVQKGDKESDVSLHEYFARVAMRLVAYLDQPHETAPAWRVDLRLRPEGTKGPLVNSLAAVEQYYETWGRTWERAALLRARPSAGDLVFGEEALSTLSPFVWRRTVEPRVAEEVIDLLLQARLEAGSDVDRDLKIGRGGIRSVEFFVQSLQLVWGGRDSSLRVVHTLDALKRLRARGLVTERESHELAEAYLFLRRLEHRVQFATGLQTHALPIRKEDQSRLAISTGFATWDALEIELNAVRQRTESRLESLVPERAARSVVTSRAKPVAIALDSGSEMEVMGALAADLTVFPDLPRHLLALARTPSDPLGARTRDTLPHFVEALLEALLDAADPAQAAMLFGVFVSRFRVFDGYQKALADDLHAMRRLVALFGASRYLGEALARHPALADLILFAKAVPTDELARSIVDEEVGALAPEEASDPFAVVGAMRRAKWRVTMMVGLADLADEVPLRNVSRVLTALADAQVVHSLALAMRTVGINSGLSLFGMGKFGGYELGYGSDLDIFFVYEGDAENAEAYVRAAQRTLRYLGMPHDDGPGYELDTALRPSGNQGLLVVSGEAFAQYHARGGNSHDWERQALIKSRFVGGDTELGDAVVALAHEAAFERGEPDTEKMNALRLRMERELGNERNIDGDEQGPARFDIKVGRGGLVDAEFAIQRLQMKHGTETSLQTADTLLALRSLAERGIIDPATVQLLEEAYLFLRRLEMRLRIVHGGSERTLDEAAIGLQTLARRMGMRAQRARSAEAQLIARYREISRGLRQTYLELIELEDRSLK